MGGYGGGGRAEWEGGGDHIHCIVRVEYNYPLESGISTLSLGREGEEEELVLEL